MSIQLLVATPKSYFFEGFDIDASDCWGALREFQRVVTGAKLDAAVDFETSRSVAVFDFLTVEIDCYREATKDAGPIVAKARGATLFLPVHIEAGLSLEFRYAALQPPWDDLRVSDHHSLGLSLACLEKYRAEQEPALCEQLGVFLDDFRRAMRLAEENRCILAYSF